MNSSCELAVRVDDDGNRRVLYVDGQLDLANAGVLRAALMDSLHLPGEGGCGGTACSGSGPATIIDLAGVQAVDLCGLQLLCSAHRTHALRGKKLSLRQVSEQFRKTATAAGFNRSTLKCPHRRGDECLWKD
jgi:hypothetical protein